MTNNKPYAKGDTVYLDTDDKGVVIAVWADSTYDVQLENGKIRNRHFDELWRCGLRPTEGTGSAGSLAATQAHLKDMKAIAFSRLKIDSD